MNRSFDIALGFPSSAETETKENSLHLGNIRYGTIEDLTDHAMGVNTARFPTREARMLLEQTHTSPLRTRDTNRMIQTVQKPIHVGSVSPLRSRDPNSLIQTAARPLQIGGISDYAKVQETPMPSKYLTDCREFRSEKPSRKRCSSVAVSQKLDQFLQRQPEKQKDKMRLIQSKERIKDTCGEIAKFRSNLGNFVSFLQGLEQGASQRPPRAAPVVALPPEPRTLSRSITPVKNFSTHSSVCYSPYRVEDTSMYRATPSQPFLADESNISYDIPLSNPRGSIDMSSIQDVSSAIGDCLNGVSKIKDELASLKRFTTD